MANQYFRIEEVINFLINNGEWVYPMLRAFHTLNLSTSNTAQSAPSSDALYELSKWSDIENALGRLTAKEFVAMGFGSPGSEALDDHPEFKEWLKTYV